MKANLHDRSASKLSNNSWDAKSYAETAKSRLELGIVPKLSKVVLWYTAVDKHKWRYSSGLAQSSRESTPFRLRILKISGLNGPKKAELHLKVRGSFIDQNFQSFGMPVEHFCSESLSAPNKWESEIVLYYHSRIDPNKSNICLSLSFSLLEIKNRTVESESHLGRLLIRDPFIENENKAAHLMQMEMLECAFGAKLSESSSLSINYRIESSLQLKKMIRLMPENALMSSQNRISGLQRGYLPEKSGEVGEDFSSQVTISYLRVQIPEKFEHEMLSYLKRVLPQAQEIKSRKLVIGYHNEYQFVGGSSCKLAFLKTESHSAQSKVGVYEGLHEKETLRVAYYDPDCPIVVCLAYETTVSTYDVGLYVFYPTKSEDISEVMMIGQGYGASGHVLPLLSDQAPTLIMEYEWEERVEKARGVTGVLQSKALQKERLKLLEEIERQKLELQKEKQQIQRVKMQSHNLYQEEFEKKFETQKDSLYRRQEIIEAQYRQQVERQIQEKFQLEEQIRLMKEKIRDIEDTGKRQQAASYQGSHQASFRSPEAEGLLLNSVVNQPVNVSTIARETKQTRIDGSYAVEEGVSVPPAKVRELIQRGIKSSPQLLKISYSQFTTASRVSLTVCSLTWEVSPHEAIYLVIRFFNRGGFRTDTLVAKGEELMRELSGQPAKYVFTIDPSEYGQPEAVQRDFVDYLNSNQCIMDVFDARTHLYVGQINVRLHQLLRGAKSQTIMAKEYPIIKGKSNLGTAQLLFANEQCEPMHKIDTKQKRKVRDIRKKVISNAPLSIAASVELSESLLTTEARQKQRIMRFKQKQSMVEQQSLIRIMEYKSKQLPHYIKGVYEGLLTETVDLTVHHCVASTFPFIFTNTSSSLGSFRVTIMSEELTLVKRSGQWRYFVDHNKYTPPKSYEMISDDDSFVLNGGESVPLVFRYLSFEQGSEAVSVTISKEETNWIVGGFTCHVQHHESAIHHSYVLYQAGDSLVDLIIPVLYANTDDSSTLKKLHLTRQNSEATWLTQYEVLLKTTTPPVMHKTSFHLLLYQNDHFDSLKENWLIQLYSYEGVCVNYRHDSRNRFKLVLPNVSESYTLLLHADSPALHFDKETILCSRSGNSGGEVWCELTSYVKSVEVTCVDKLDQHLVYGWVVQVYPYEPR